MTVNPDDLLIFKMRGMTTVQKKRVEKVEAAQAPQPQPAVVQPVVTKPQEVKKERKPFFAPKPAPTPMPEVRGRAEEKIIPEKPKEVAPKRPFFAPKPKPAPKAAPKKREEVPKKEELPSWVTPPPATTPEEEKRVREMESLEQTIALYANPPGGLEAEQAELKQAQLGGKVARTAFSTLSGLLFVADAVVFGYFIFPQSVFLLGYIMTGGLHTFLLNWSYEYGTAFVNLILDLLLAISGISMLANAKLSHLVTGAAGSIILLAITFEYLNSSAIYLLVVSVIAFLGIASLAYARMSAVITIEQEEEKLTMPQEVGWPRLETF